MPRSTLPTIAALALLGSPSITATTLAHGGGGRGGHGGFAHHGHHGYRYGGFYPGFGVGLGFGYGYWGYPYWPLAYGGYGYPPAYPGYFAPGGVVAVPAVKPQVVAPPGSPGGGLPVAQAAVPPATSHAPQETLPPPLADDGAGRIRVRLPADAALWIDGEATAQKGAERTFETPELAPGKVYLYEVKARWSQGGRPAEQSFQVEVRAGRTTTVHFGGPPPSVD
jgi:uncharacterized protein (TIGR03000 family)